ncbi:MAG: hypothetical protein AAF639_30050 [Chloroflexota bacterium]
MNKSQTDFELLEQMTDDDIDLSDIPALTDEMMTRGVVRKGLGMGENLEMAILVDHDVYDEFKQRGVDYQQWLNGLLRAAINLHETTTPPQVTEILGTVRNFSAHDRFVLASLLLGSLGVDETAKDTAGDGLGNASFLYSLDNFDRFGSEHQNVTTSGNS